MNYLDNIILERVLQYMEILHLNVGFTKREMEHIPFNLIFQIMARNPFHKMY